MKPTRFVPTLVNALSGYDVVEVATGKAHALFLTGCGKVNNGSEDERRLILLIQRCSLPAVMTMASVDRDGRLATLMNQRWSVLK